ncbi:MAG: hypothetical protein WBQ09_09725 [Terriglobales bacterium]
MNNENDMNKDMYGDVLSPNGDGCSDPDTDSNNNPNPNPNPETSTSNSSGHAQNKVEGTPASQTEPSISAKQLQANRQNAKRSTGPKTARGKAHSRFNALKHGLLSDKIMFTPDGELQDEGLLELLQSLRDKYGRGDVRTELLVEGTVVEYWRRDQGLKFEMKCLKQTGWTFCQGGAMPNVQRYTTASQRAFLKNLELLDKLQPSTSEVDEDRAESDAPAPQPEVPPQAPKAANSTAIGEEAEAA